MISPIPHEAFAALASFVPMPISELRDFSSPGYNLDLVDILGSPPTHAFVTPSVQLDDYCLLQIIGEVAGV